MEQRDGPKTLIAGAGIAGLCVANGLLRAGWADRFDIVDPDPRPVGVAVGLSSASLRALQNLGVLGPVLKASAPSMTLHMCARDGSDLVYAERSQPPGQPYPDNVVVERSTLADALTAPLRHVGRTIRSGVGVRAVRQLCGSAEVEFDDGRTAEYDLVVGADGAASRIRRAVTAESPEPLDQLGLRWVMGPVDGLDHGVMYLGSRASKLGLWPLRSGRTYAFLTLPMPQRLTRDREVVLAALSEVLASFSFPGAERVRQEVDREGLHIARFQAFAPAAPWHRGRLVLAGDAAHVMPPHGSSGAAMAIEDADVLTRQLERLPIPDALDAYSARRVDRVRRVVEFSERNCRAENDAAARGIDQAPLLDPGESQEFWEFLRTEP